MENTPFALSLPNDPTVHTNIPSILYILLAPASAYELEEQPRPQRHE